jgi:hypothetical protein
VRIAERLSSFIAQSKLVTLVERIQVDKAFRETSLGQTGAIDERRAAQAGKMLGATYIIVGSFSLEGASESIQARIVNAETGVVTASVIKDGPKEQALIDAVAIKLLDDLGVNTTYDRAYRVKRSLAWVSSIAAVGCGGAAYLSHSRFKDADQDYRTAVDGSAGEFDALADEARLYSNARMYFVGGSAALLGAGIVLFIINKSAWKFEPKKTTQGVFLPILTPHSVGLSYTLNIASHSDEKR